MPGDPFKNLFPVDDAEARFVLVLCLARNDLVVTAEQIVAANEDDNGTNLHWARILAAHLFEATSFLRQNSSKAASKKLRASLPPERKAEHKKLLDAEFLKSKLAYDRHLTFHYPSVDSEDARNGGPQLALAMSELEDDSLDIRVKYNEKGEPTRYWYRFADLIAAEFSMAEFGRSKEEQESGIRRIQDAAFSFVRFADAVFYEWGQRHGISLGAPEPFPPDK